MEGNKDMITGELSIASNPKYSDWTVLLTDARGTAIRRKGLQDTGFEDGWGTVHTKYTLPCSSQSFRKGKEPAD
jgi:hypothetical protein